MPIIAVTGLIGSGKDAATTYIADHYGYRVLDHSAILSEILGQLGRPTTREEKRRLRIERGNAFTAEAIISVIQQEKLEKIVIGSLRRPEEFELTRQAFPDAKLLVVTARAKTRFARLQKRGRDAPRTWNEFLRADRREEEIFEFSRTFRYADARISNDGTLEDLHRRIDAFMAGLARPASLRIVFFGPPGAGKGTYASRIAPLLGIPHISTGHLIRQEIAAKTPFGRRIKGLIARGDLLPDVDIHALLKARLRKADARNGYILDGYPRTLPQAETLQATPPALVINLVVGDRLLRKKLAGRRTCPACGRSYNLTDASDGKIHLPPLLPKVPGTCDACGAGLVQRDEDWPAAIEHRLAIYRAESAPLLAFYRRAGTLRNILVTGTPETMVPRILNLIKATGVS